MIILVLITHTTVMINRIYAARDGELSIPSRIIGQSARGADRASTTLQFQYNKSMEI